MNDHATTGRYLIAITGIVLGLASFNAAVEWITSTDLAVTFGALVLTTGIVTAMMVAICQIGRR